MKNMRFRGVILFFLFKTDFLTKYYKKEVYLLVVCVLFTNFADGILLCKKQEN